MKKLILFFVMLNLVSVQACNNGPNTEYYEIMQSVKFHRDVILPGAYQTDQYLDDLKGKKVGVVANQTSMISLTHLVDSMLSFGIDIKAVFSPEHGFRGKAEAGERFNSSIDPKTGLPLVSLYGKNKKPSDHDLEGLDVMVFDIQDVGARFYTYISTLHLVMEACAENGIPVLVLDRPNPNGHYVDGPILEEEQKSFIGMHKVPIVHGMTIGEYAMMIKGEAWINKAESCELKVIKCKNYDHNSFYRLPIDPSPNLQDMHAIYLYPSLCLLEGTVVSVGRGTDSPFRLYGHPDFSFGDTVFVPRPNEGASIDLKLKGVSCRGEFLSGIDSTGRPSINRIELVWLIKAYNEIKSEEFFKSSFNLLAGNTKLRQQLADGLSEEEIRATWKPGLEEFKVIRAKYLLYKDF